MQTTQTNLLLAVRDMQNREAWGRFYGLYAPMLHNFTRRMGLSDSDVDDVTQETLMIAHRSLVQQRYDPAKGRFRHWLYGIARRQTLAALRARRRRTRVQWTCAEGEVDFLDQLADLHSEQTMQEIWQQEWRYAVLDEALRHVRMNLGEKTVRAFEMFALQHQAVEAVAEQLELTPSSVYVYKSRVMGAIRQWVRRYEDA